MEDNNNPSNLTEMQGNNDYYNSQRQTQDNNNYNNSYHNNAYLAPEQERSPVQG